MKGETGQRPIRILSESAVSPLGTTLEEHLRTLRKGGTGISRIEDPNLAETPFYGGMVDRDRVDRECPADPEEHPLFERLCILAAERAIEGAGIDPSDPSTLFMITTTKGNIDLLSSKPDAGKGREYLAEAAKGVVEHWNRKDRPWVLSNACISGVLAIDTAADLLRRGRYQRAVVLGGDILSAFTVSGFQAFLALSPAPCRPYDEGREGLNLGEGAAAVVLEALGEEDRKEEGLYVMAGASSNDANHISGPSRTGEGLAQAIERSLTLSGIDAWAVDHLNAHGTATPYNDEMEAKAFNRSGLSKTPMNSFKGALGHSLGAAGVVESSIVLACMRSGELLPSVGYSDHGVSLPLNIIRDGEKRGMNTCLKTSSGFGGCNAALLFQRI